MDHGRVVGRKAFNFWVLVASADDLPGQWVAHCLEYDIVTQGNSPKHAIEQLGEAVSMCLTEDLNDGHDPSERPRAPDEYWDRLSVLMTEGEKLGRDQVDRALDAGGRGEHGRCEYALCMTASFAQVEAPADPRTPRRERRASTPKLEIPMGLAAHAAHP